MKIKCKAYFEYEIIIEANDATEAETAVFDALADDATNGIIRMDLFDNGDGANMRFPELVSVEVENQDVNE